MSPPDTLCVSLRDAAIWGANSASRRPNLRGGTLRAVAAAAAVFRAPSQTGRSAKRRRNCFERAISSACRCPPARNSPPPPPPPQTGSSTQDCQSKHTYLLDAAGQLDNRLTCRNLLLVAWLAAAARDSDSSSAWRAPLAGARRTHALALARTQWRARQSATDTTAQFHTRTRERLFIAAMPRASVVCCRLFH